MMKVLLAKGCHEQYIFCLNAGHGIGDAKPQFLPLALEWLRQGHPIAKAQNRDEVIIAPHRRSPG